MNSLYGLTFSPFDIFIMNNYSKDDLRLSHNLLYGKLKFMDFMCETRKKGGYFAFSADCDGTPPEIICSCCDICCDKFDVCYNMVS